MIRTFVAASLTLSALILGGAAHTRGGVVAPELTQASPSDTTVATAPRTAVEVPQDAPLPEVPVTTPETPAATLPDPVQFVVPVECDQEDTCDVTRSSAGQWILDYGQTYTPDRAFSVVLPVDCPAEDSCLVDYRGDIQRWVITEYAIS